MSDRRTCGHGLAEQSRLPAKLAELTASLAENLEIHLNALDLTDENSRAEHEAWRSLANQHRQIAAQLHAVGEEMAGHRDLPMGRHDETAMSSPEIVEAFERFVEDERELLTLLGRKVDEDEALLAEMRGAGPGESSDPAQALIRELSDFAAPWAVWIAATLRLAGHVEAGASQLEELAGRAGADPKSLGRLLRYLVARGVFAEEDGRYANTDVSKLLVGEDGWRPWLDLDGAPGVWAESWTRLLEAVRKGSPGRDEGWYYEELARMGRGASFDALMAAQA
jgi:hypothetical protein